MDFHEKINSVIKTSKSLKKSDPPTDFPNRRQQSDSNTYWLGILDIDFFKNFNDTHGHVVGDKVLQKMAKLCQDSVRTSDVFARLRPRAPGWLPAWLNGKLVVITLQSEGGNSK